MPDLTTITVYACQTAEDYTTTVTGSKGDIYTVRLGRLFGIDLERFGCMFGWSCTCAGFRRRYRPRGQYCKHIKEAQKAHCGWDGMVDGGEPVDGKCPRCGAPVVARQEGV